MTATLSEKLLTPGQVAATFRVTSKTIAHWADAGKLSCIRTLGGHRRYYEDEIQAVLGVVPAAVIRTRSDLYGQGHTVTVERDASGPVVVERHDGHLVKVALTQAETHLPMGVAALTVATSYGARYVGGAR